MSISINNRVRKDFLSLSLTLSNAIASREGYAKIITDVSQEKQKFIDNSINLSSFLSPSSAHSLTLLFSDRDYFELDLVGASERAT